jgi:ferredoxin
MATIISADNLKALAGELLKTKCRVIAPVRAADMVLFKAIADPKEMLPEGEYVLPHSSFKEFLFPKCECILTYRFPEKGKAVYETPNLDSEPAQVILGCRPCDAASLPILDKVFDWDYHDDFYFKRREKTTIVSIACSRTDDRCFCTSVGYAPDSKDGSDMLLRKSANDRYVVEVLTDKGKKLQEQFAKLFETADAAPPVEVAKLEPAFDVEKIKPWLDTHFDDPLWMEIASRCIGCGTCAYGCPTCHCFDIVDEGDLNGGCRLKNWDTCAATLFTKHGSGHNPRSSQDQRMRQRVLHKFKYYIEKFGLRACVGCGRCSNRCPVNNDLYDTLLQINEKVKGETR